MTDEDRIERLKIRNKIFVVWPGRRRHPLPRSGGNGRRVAPVGRGARPRDGLSSLGGLDFRESAGRQIGGSGGGHRCGAETDEM